MAVPPKWRFLIILTAVAVYVAIKFWPAPGPAPRAQRVTCAVVSSATQVARADLVLSGEVFAVLPHAEGAEVLIQTNQVFKGTVPEGGANIITALAQSAGGTLGTQSSPAINFQSGQPPYLLFLRSREDGRFSADRCGGTRLLGSGLTDEEAAALGGESASGILKL